MNSIVICTVVWICVTIVHGENYDKKDEESELSVLKYAIGRYIDKYNDVINQTESIITYQIFVKITELMEKPVVETLEQIKLQTEAAEKGGANKTHCYEAAKLNSTTARKHAFDATIACGEEYMKIIKANLTKEFELLKTMYMMYSSSENGIDQTTTDRLIALETQYIKILMNLLAVTSEDSLSNSTELDSCLGKFISSVIEDVQNIQSHATACILAS